MRRLIDGIEGYSEYLDAQASSRRSMARCRRGARANLQADIEASGAVVAAEKLPVVIGNPHLLMLLFQNLIGNAIKYRRPETSLRVDIGAEPCQGGCALGGATTAWASRRNFSRKSSCWENACTPRRRFQAMATACASARRLSCAAADASGWNRLGEGSTFFSPGPRLANLQS